MSLAKPAAPARSAHIKLDFQQQAGACYVAILDDGQIVAQGRMKWIDDSAFNGWYTSFEVRVAGGYATGVYFPVAPAQPFIQGYGGGDVVYPSYTGECPTEGEMEQNGQRQRHFKTDFSKVPRRCGQQPDQKAASGKPPMRTRQG